MKKNLKLQGRGKHLPHLAGKIGAFTHKLDMWGRRLQGNTDCGESRTEFSETSDSGAITVIPRLQEHMSSMKGLFPKYFPNDSAQWVRDAFNVEAPADFSSAEEEQFIEMTSEITLESPVAVYSSGTGGILAWCGREHALIELRGLWEFCLLLPHPISLRSALVSCCHTGSQVKR